eukprot:gene8814-11203_t
MHCDDPGCLKACPAPGAIVQYTNGIVDFISDNCIGCGYCVKGCPFNIPRISQVTSKAYKCTLCSDRVVVGQAPACAKACPTQAIYFGTKEDMIAHAGKRITDLKSRGYQNAGLYNPPGVNGTHVMYVLQHADKPSLYAGLPDNPHISPLVGIWKGVMKPLSLAAIAFAGAYACHRLRPRWLPAFELAVMSPLFFPHAALGVALVNVLAMAGYLGTATGIVIAHILCTLPFAWRPIVVAL